jgi:hypothetical protein
MKNKTDFPLTNKQGEKITLGMRLFLKKCLAKQPQNRFASAKEMRDDFSLILLENSIFVGI